MLLGSATQAGSSSSAVVIIGFNVRPEARAADVAKQEDVDIRLHSIIYKVEEEIRAAMIGMLEAIEKLDLVHRPAVASESDREAGTVAVVGLGVDPRYGPATDDDLSSVSQVVA